MIYALTGKISGFGVSSVVVATSGGVDYEVHVPLDVFRELQNRSEENEVKLYIHHRYSQDDQKLYGFSSLFMRDFFIAVQTIKGIGPSLALSILSHLTPDLLLELCEKNNVASLTKIPRIGKNTAETIIFEINRKKERWRLLTNELKVQGGQPPIDEPLTGERELATLALLQLGYRENQIKAALDAAEKSSEQKKELSASEWIAAALKLIK